MTTSEPALKGYEEKTQPYYENSRLELLQFVPPGIRSVLDVGCGTGRFGEALQKDKQCEVWGVEPDPRAAQYAVDRLHRVTVELFTPELNLPLAFFDLICFNDVLEHMPMPEVALQHARKLLRPGGLILASVPNFRQFNNIWELIVLGNATYRESGIMDKTHLRIFTFKSIRLLFEESGYYVERIDGINSQFTRRLFNVFNFLTFGAVTDMQWLQVVIVARPNVEGVSSGPEVID
jgi:2-polyprenyl-3-methyl-5-hydroxy-6-metoxy-1,4-benzoquinol methylase